MVQQFSKILENVLQQAWKYGVRNQVIKFLNKPSTQRSITTGIQNIWEELRISISSKIDSRNKEAKVIINVHKQYCVGEVKDSTVIQGDNIRYNVNNTEININVALIQDITMLKKYCEDLKEADQKLNFLLITEDRNYEKIKKIDAQVDSISKNIKEFIEPITDYSVLQKALGTVRIN